MTLLAIVSVSFPSIGPNRFLLAGLLVFVVVPLTIIFERRYPAAQYGWSDPLFNVVTIITLVHLVPDAWVAVLMVGLMVAAVSSIRVSAHGYLLYGGLNLLLLAGMSFAAIVHDVEGWVLPIAAILAVLPGATYYAYWEYSHVTALRDRARRVKDLTVIAGGVAHDFRNILTAVSGFAELARLELPEEHPARASVDELATGARRASLLASQLLAFSGREVRSTSSLDLEAEVRTLTRLLRSVVPKGVDLVIDAEGSLPMVRGDRAQLQQVILNLLMNACDAITEVPAVVEIRLWHEPNPFGKDRIVCEVRDSGSGISAESLPKIFDPFFTSKPQGHGLGLASVKRILAEHDGGIEVRSQKGKGTDMRFWLPAYPAMAADGESQKPAVATGGGRVLIVDDEPQIRNVLRQFLGRLGYETLEAEDGFQALDRFREQATSVDLVILDLKMPGLDGWQCSREIRRIRSDVPIIISSAYDPQGSAEWPERVTFLPKPYRFQDLERTLEQALTN